jgi:hypothetical protein
MFLAGISQLRALYRTRKTRFPVEVFSKQLFAAGVYYNIDSGAIADSAAKTNRTEVRAGTDHMTSFFHEKMALGKIRQLLLKHNLYEVSARDSFPNSVTNEVRWLNRLGAGLKSVTAKYKVINRRGQPFLQIAAPKGRLYQDCQNMPRQEEEPKEEEILMVPNIIVTGPERQRHARL